MTQNYTRLVEVFVKPDLRDKIKLLKREQTYDEYLRVLIEKKEGPTNKDPRTTSAKKGDSY